MDAKLTSRLCLPTTYKGREIVYDMLYPPSYQPQVEGDKVRMNPQFAVDLVEGRK